MANSRFFACAFTLLLCAWAAQAAVIVSQQDFDDVNALSASGWVLTNNSAPPGTTGWFQGNGVIFPAQSGPPDSYIAANLNNAAFGGNISNWLLTPEIWVNDGDALTFATRTSTAATFPDRLEVRLSSNGGSVNVGGSDTSAGDFGTLLLSVNPMLVAGGYPTNWTFFAVTVNGIAKPSNGRFAFRYAVLDTSVNADYIGIDSVTISQVVPEPASAGLIVLGLAVLAGWRSGRLRSAVLFGTMLLTVSARPALSEQAGKPEEKKTPSHSAPAAKGGARIAIDRKTGKIRPLEREDVEALQASPPAAARVLPVPTMVQRPDGIQSVQLDERYWSSTVIRRNPDGSTSVNCVRGSGTPARGTKNPTASEGSAKEAAHDR